MSGDKNTVRQILSKEQILKVRDEQLEKAGFESNEAWLVNFAYAILAAAQSDVYVNTSPTPENEISPPLKAETPI